MRDKLTLVYKLLLDHFGHRNWWPGDTCVEICVGAVLTQNTSWKNVEKAIGNLKAADCIDIESILNLDDKKLAEFIRPSGYFNLKTKRLKSVLQFIKDKGGIEKLQKATTKKLRDELLEVYGVGPETADSIMLYALDHRVFVIDAYTKRIFSRLGICDPDVDYHELQKLFMDNFPKRKKLYNDYHAQIVALGANFCKPKPNCENCPLAEICKFK